MCIASSIAVISFTLNEYAMEHPHIELRKFRWPGKQARPRDLRSQYRLLLARRPKPDTGTGQGPDSCKRRDQPHEVRYVVKGDRDQLQTLDVASESLVTRKRAAVE